MNAENSTAQDIRSFMTVKEAQGIFVDALLTDESDCLIFVSFWGRDTSIRELQARLTLGSSEGGLTAFNVINVADQDKVFASISNIDSVEQMTGRVQTTILGELVHCLIYQREIVKPDLANHRAIVIQRGHQASETELEVLWGTIKAVCPIPLLDHWADVLIPIMKNLGMIKYLQGINQTGTRIMIDEDEMAAVVKQECIGQRLRLTA